MDWWLDKAIAFIGAAAAIVAAWLSYRALKLQSDRTPPLLVVSAAEMPSHPGWLRLFAYQHDGGSHPFRINYIEIRKPRHARILRKMDAFVPTNNVNSTPEMKNPLPRNDASQRQKDPAFSAEGSPKPQFVAFISLNPKAPHTDLLEIEFNLSWRDRMSRTFALIHEVRVTATASRQAD